MKIPHHKPPSVVNKIPLKGCLEVPAPLNYNLYGLKPKHILSELVAKRIKSRSLGGFTGLVAAPKVISLRDFIQGRSLIAFIDFSNATREAINYQFSTVIYHFRRSLINFLRHFESKIVRIQPQALNQIKTHKLELCEKLAIN